MGSTVYTAYTGEGVIFILIYVRAHGVSIQVYTGVCRGCVPTKIQAGSPYQKSACHCVHSVKRLKDENSKA